ncbi:nuclease-related domain-containing protein [Mycoplasmopsis gallinarum]|uniref:nuclease-related domain-containing protein n=1 Tax=Mycoplasmopsis gallinarum TaxID=29557 RepID=UPI0004813349|nr:nuclease-related domain-containing protein [Mycoplasmopsis gallinarum]
MNFSKLSLEMRWGLILGSIGMFIVIILLIVLYFWLKLRKKQIVSKGVDFERQINNDLKNYAKAKNFHFIEGGWYKYNTNKIFNLDGLLITPFGVFVIEIKYLLGKLSGEIENQELTLTDNKNKKRKVKNPFKQNYRHIIHLYDLAKFNFPAYSLVIMPNGTTWNLNEENSWSLIATENTYQALIEDVINTTKIDGNFISKDQKKALLYALKNATVDSDEGIKKVREFQNE